MTSGTADRYTCFGLDRLLLTTTWGVSASGEDVFFRDPQNQVLDSTTYPDEPGAEGIANGESWGRLPNGTGGFRRPTSRPAK